MAKYFDVEAALADGADINQINAYMKANGLISKPKQQPQPTPQELPKLPEATPQGLPPIETGYLGLPKQKAEGNFLGNLGKDIGENLSGLIGLPGALIDMAKNPSKLPEVAGNVIKGVATEYGSIAQDPLAMAYNKPLTTALDVIPVIGPAVKGVRALSSIGKLSKAEKAARALSTAGKVADVTSDIGKLEKGVDITSDISRARRTTKGLIKSEKIVSPAAKQFSSIFTVPTKRAKDLKPLETSQQLLDYGITGKSLDELRTIDNTVNTVINATKNKIINTATGEIDIGDIYKGTQEQLKKSLSIDPKESKRIMSLLSSKKPVGNQILKSSPQQAFELQKQLETMGHQYLSHNTYLTGNMHDEQLGRALLDAAESLGEKIDTHFQAGDINNFKIPEYISYLENVSPGLAQKYIDAKTFKELRSLQAPFVRTEKMIDLTDQASLSMGSKVATSVKELGNQAVQPIVKEVSSSILPKVQTSIAGMIDSHVGNIAKGGVKTVGTAIKKIPQETMIGRNLPEIGATPPNGNQYQVEPTETSKQIFDQKESSGEPSMYPWENYTADVARDPKNKAFYKEQYEHYNKKDKGLSSTQIKTANLAKSGLRQMANVEKMLGLTDEQGNPTGRLDDSILSTYQFSPLGMGARSWDNSTFAIADAILRERSGAAVPPKEVKQYRDSLFPRWGDTPEDIKQKVDELRLILKDMYNQEPSSQELPSPIDGQLPIL